MGQTMVGRRAKHQEDLNVRWPNTERHPHALSSPRAFTSERWTAASSMGLPRHGVESEKQSCACKEEQGVRNARIEGENMQTQMSQTAMPVSSYHLNTGVVDGSDERAEA